MQSWDRYHGEQLCDLLIRPDAEGQTGPGGRIGGEYRCIRGGRGRDGGGGVRWRGRRSGGSSGGRSSSSSGFNVKCKLSRCRSNGGLSSSCCGSRGSSSSSSGSIGPRYEKKRPSASVLHDPAVDHVDGHGAVSV